MLKLGVNLQLLVLSVLLLIFLFLFAMSFLLLGLLGLLILNFIVFLLPFVLRDCLYHAEAQIILIVQELEQTFQWPLHIVIERFLFI